MTVVTRFAPSPTGLLHIGGARTALFNWLFSKHNKGKFLLRIEDTDRERSTDQAVDAIIEGLGWLGVNWDNEIIFQSDCIEQHRSAANSLLKAGKAYHCYCTQAELTKMRESARKSGSDVTYDGRCRKLTKEDIPDNVKPTLRFISPNENNVVIHDKVQGDVAFPAEQLDDMILLRSDGSPTYMLAVVVDDHDMNVTHIIRGVDHLTNAARQKQLYEALGWESPIFAHIPLIHGHDGSKLSKRHGATAAQDYKEKGYLPEAMRNYLSRLGWSHGDEEIFSTDQAIEWFNLESIGRSPARFDSEKLRNLNGHYLQTITESSLYDRIKPELRAIAGDQWSKTLENRVRILLPELRKRCKDINELIDLSRFLIVSRPIILDAKARKILDEEGRSLLYRILSELRTLEEWTSETIESVLRSFSGREDVKLGAVAQPLRAAITGRSVSPGIFEVLEVLGPKESLSRISDQI